MGHWKGTKVLIEICEVKGEWRLEYAGHHYLDTDTMSDLFDEFPPSDYAYRIAPLKEDE